MVSPRRRIHAACRNHLMTQADRKALPDARSRPAPRGYPHPHPGGAGEIRLRAERLPHAGLPPRRVSRLLCLSRRADGEGLGLSKAEREMIVVATSAANQCQYCRDRPWRDPAHPRQESGDRRPDRGQLPQGRHHAAAARDARFRHEGEPAPPRRSRRRTSPRSPPTASATTTSGTSPRSRLSSRSRTGWRTSPACGRTPSSTCSAGSRK